jgi:mannose/cellobiose epimerase-like protein (N-acyl-D-glucosamine 2-epimerase family)
MGNTNQMGLEAEAKRASNWLCEFALPLWANQGFDRSHGAFHEQLDFSLAPVLNVPSRLMVQSRQVAVFAAAALSGRFSGGREIALLAAENMVHRYERADGDPGWILSIGRTDNSSNHLRDLYAHAFALFGLAWVLRLEKRQTFLDAIDRTLAFLDDFMADPVAGGYWDSIPRTDNLRRQNPHMHLFEAFIALYEATGDRSFLSRSKTLRNLAIERFLVPQGGALREYFFDDWSVAPSEGSGSVEPGHLFEWSWLLRRYQTASGEDQSDPIDRMMTLAIDRGLDEGSGRIVDKIGENGTLVDASSRSWPHAEALKALTAVSPELDSTRVHSITAILNRLMTIYCPLSLAGGWQDHFNSMDLPMRTSIPASTLYHLYFGITAVEDAIGLVARAPQMPSEI